MQTALDAFGRIDIVVNNAGILRDKAFHNMTDDLVQPVLDVHLRRRLQRPPARPGRRCASRLRACGEHPRRRPASSRQLRPGELRRGEDGSGRATQVLAIEGARYDIKANAISPIARLRMTEEVLGNLVEYVDPASVSPLVAWLVHEDLPGEAATVLGGRRARVARFFVGLTPGYLDKA